MDSSKCILITLLAVSFVAVSQGSIFSDAADEIIYKAIHTVLVAKYPGEEKLVKCIDLDFRGSNLAKKFGSNLVLQPDDLKKEIASDLNVAETKCKIGLFFQSPIGIIIIIGISLVVILICCCLIKCIFC